MYLTLATWHVRNPSECPWCIRTMHTVVFCFGYIIDHLGITNIHTKLAPPPTHHFQTLTMSSMPPPTHHFQTLTMSSIPPVTMCSVPSRSLRPQAQLQMLSSWAETYTREVLLTIHPGVKLGGEVGLNFSQESLTSPYFLPKGDCESPKRRLGVSPFKQFLFYFFCNPTFYFIC
jgi:hypothetical protein